MSSQEVKVIISPLGRDLAAAAQAPKSGGLPVPPQPTRKWEYCCISLHALLRRRGKAVCESQSGFEVFLPQVSWQHSTVDQW